MQIGNVTTEKNREAAIQYAYKKGIYPKYSYDTFKRMVLNSFSDTLPEFYILKSNEKYIGYLLLLPDTMENLPQPFQFLAAHNGDELSNPDHRDLLRFIVARAAEKKWPTFEKIAKHELASLQRE